LLQRELIIRPDAGKIIQGSGGLRKIRWFYGGKGKSGGVRIFYYWHQIKEIILLLFIFAKNEQSDLTTEQLKQLRQIIEEEYK
jgi:mRNA-degrading endonuclease RelE of RelBE toxin-antitoxin system